MDGLAPGVSLAPGPGLPTTGDSPGTLDGITPVVVGCADWPGAREPCGAEPDGVTGTVLLQAPTANERATSAETMDRERTQLTSGGDRSPGDRLKV